jgi:hypothetical protein
VSVGEIWIDLVYDDGQRKVNRSWELFDEVLPRSVNTEVNANAVMVKVDKAQDGEWPSLTTEDEPIAPELTPEVLQRLNIPEHTDARAAQMFEIVTALAREERLESASWFFD